MKEGKIRQTRSDDFTMMAKIAYKNEKELSNLNKQIKSSKFVEDFNNEVNRIESLKSVTLATIDIIGNEYMLTLSILEGFNVSILQFHISLSLIFFSTINNDKRNDYSDLNFNQ